MSIQTTSLPNKPDFLRVLREKKKEFGSFWKTKRAVAAGKPLYIYTPEQLAAEELMNPWAFNLAESVFASLPALTVVKILSFFYPAPSPEPSILPKNATFWQSVFAKAPSYYPQILGWFVPFLVPITLLALSRLFARASLKKSDTTTEKRERARVAYLYLDGACGLLPQLLLAFGANVGLTCLINGVPTPEPIAIVLLLMVVVGSWWGLFISGRTVPRKLFAINGYSDKIPHFWRRAEADSGPWSKYTVALLLGAPTMGWGLLLLMVVLSWIISIAAAAAKVFVSG